MIRTCRTPWPGFMLIAIAALAVTPAPHIRAQNGPPLHVDVKLVSVFVSVTDQNGAPVGGLTRDDFSIAEDDRAQKISIFERESDMPLNLTLAIDTSDSVFKDLADEKGAARGFVQAVLRPQDQINLLGFSTAVQELTQFTKRADVIERGIARMQGGGATAFYDAIVLGSERLGRQKGRKVLVVVSDGDDTVKGSNYEQALEAALRNEVMIYSLIDVPIEESAGRDLRGEHALITLAEDTGGKSFYLDAGGLKNSLMKVSEDLRTQYFIAYYPHNQKLGTNFHRIQITVPKAAASYNVRYRTGYYTGSINTPDPSDDWDPNFFPAQRPSATSAGSPR
jgi:Ca-activated chloride channel family protein